MRLTSIRAEKIPPIELFDASIQAESKGKLRTLSKYHLENYLLDEAKGAIQIHSKNWRRFSLHSLLREEVG